jgi:hypothetical protein
MIKELVVRFSERRHEIAQKLKEKHPDDYKELVGWVVEALRGDDGYDYDSMDKDRIHEIDDGHYQGTLVYVIGGVGYQPSQYWYVKVSYGSCSGCDTLEGIRGYEHEKPNDEQIKDYMTLALHIVQGIKKMDETEV